MDRDTARASLDAIEAAEQRATEQLSTREVTHYFFMAAFVALANGAALLAGVRRQWLWLVIFPILIMFVLLQVWGSRTRLPAPGWKAFTPLALYRLFLLWILIQSLFSLSLTSKTGLISDTHLDYYFPVFLVATCMYMARTEKSELVYLRCFLSQTVCGIFLSADPWGLGFRLNPVAYSVGIGIVFLIHGAFGLRAQRA
jgi:hypothetical protein